jgi:hypothetical protein
VKTRIVFTLSICLLLAAACTPATTPTATVDSWQTYSNPAGFSIRYPATWSKEEVPQKAGDTYQTVSLQGTEGGVDLHWGVGFGGACPQGYTTVKAADGELPACYTKNADGTELWTQINKELATTSFSAEAHTNNADPTSHDLVLQVLATLSFP